MDIINKRLDTDTIITGHQLFLNPTLHHEIANKKSQVLSV